MKIGLSSSNIQYGISFFKEIDLSFLSGQQKKILVIASIVFGALTACFFVARYFFANRNLKQIPLNKEECTKDLVKPKEKETNTPVAIPTPTPLSPQSHSEGEDNQTTDELSNEIESNSSLTEEEISFSEDEILDISNFDTERNDALNEVKEPSENLRSEPEGNSEDEELTSGSSLNEEQSKSEEGIIDISHHFSEDEVQEEEIFLQDNERSDEISLPFSSHSDSEKKEWLIVPFLDIHKIWQLTFKKDDLKIKPQEEKPLQPKHLVPFPYPYFPPIVPISPRTKEWAIIPLPKTHPLRELTDKANSEIKPQDEKNLVQGVLVPYTGMEKESVSSSSTWNWLVGKVKDVSSIVFEKAKDVGNSILDTTKNTINLASQGNQARLELIKGIDLEPFIMGAYKKGKESTQAVLEFLNAPSAEYDTVTSNLMQGFAKELGFHLHFLLLNAARLGGPKLAGELAARLNLVNMVGQPIGNMWLKLSNPLGWGALMVDLADMGIKVQDICEVSLIARIEEHIDALVFDLAINAGLKEEHIKYMQKKAALYRAEKAYESEVQILIDQLKEKNLLEQDYTSESLITLSDEEWFVEHEKKFATAEYKSTQEALHIAQLHVDTIKLEKPITLSFCGKWIPFANLTSFLIGTSKKTLGHFVADMHDILDAKFDEKIPVTSSVYTHIKNYIQQGMKDYIKQGLHTMILSGQARVPEVYKQLAVKTTVKELKDFNKGCSKPVGTVVEALPKKMKEKASSLVAPFNDIIGQATSKVFLASMDEELINQLGLKNLDLFKQDQLAFDIRKSIQEMESISNDMKEYIQIFLEESPYNLDVELQNLTQLAGKEMAKMFSLALAKRFETMLKEKGLTYKAEDLMSQEVPLPILAQLGGTVMKTTVQTAFTGLKELAWTIHDTYEAAKQLKSLLFNTGVFLQ